MKKLMCVLAVLVIVLLFAVSCSSGVSKDEFNKATSDLTAKTAELTQAKTSLDAANAKLVKARAESAVLNAIFIPALTGELNQMSEADQTALMLTMESNIKTIGDPALQQKWDAMKNSGGDTDTTMAFFQYLLQDIAKTLE